MYLLLSIAVVAAGLYYWKRQGTIAGVKFPDISFLKSDKP